MNKLIDKYVSMIVNKYKEECASIIVYGSIFLEGEINDFDVCIITRNEVDDCTKNLIIHDTKQFSIDNGLRIDEEVPYESKLLYSIAKVEAYVLTNPFINKYNKYEIRDIEKNREFLSSDEMRHRLLLNILTTLHKVAYGDELFIECCKKRAWKIIYHTVNHYYDWGMVDTDTFVKGLYKNQKTNKEGEMFLGYKSNNICKDEYLRKSVDKYLQIFRNEKNDLASNINPYFPTPSMESDLIHTISLVKEYPQNKDISIRKKVAECLGVKDNQVIMTNGVMEGINLLIDCLDCKSTSIFAPSFWGYENSLVRLNKKYDKIRFSNTTEHYMEVIENGVKDHDCVILCNPNNPTLNELSYKELHTIICNNPNCHFIIDESMLCFKSDFITESMIENIGKNDNLSIMLSMSKISGMCALRGGFLFSNEKVIESIIKKRPLYTTNISAQIIFEKYFEQIILNNYYKKKVSDNIHIFIECLNKEYIKKIIRGDTIYLLLEFTENVNTEELEDYLSNNNYLVRNMKTSYPDVEGNTIRVSGGTKEQMIDIAIHINSFLEDKYGKK